MSGPVFLLVYARLAVAGRGAWSGGDAAPWPTPRPRGRWTASSSTLMTRAHLNGGADLALS